MNRPDRLALAVDATTRRRPRPEGRVIAMTRTRLTGVGVLALLVLTTVLPAAGSGAAHTAAGGRAKADLQVTSLVVPSAVVRGEEATVRTTVKNAGRRAAARTTTRFYLSTDQQPDGRDRLLGATNLGRLLPGKSKTVSTQFAIPVGTAVRSYYVVACADATRKVRETREGNNCRPGRLSVTEPQPPTTTFPQTPDPLSVESSLQEERAVTQTAYAHEDSTITATAADGTTYTLVVPAGALLGPEQITMTPVASVPDLPLSGGLVAGVQLEPHGLLLRQPAQLTIESPDAGPLAAQTAFLFHEEGADFHLYPMDAPAPADDVDTVRLSLTHFSTPGLGSGTAADRASVAERVPARTQAQVEAAVSEFLRQERAHQQSGGEPNPEVTQQVTEVMNQYHDDVIRPRMEAAETDETLAAEAIAEGLSWSRQMQLLGDEDNPRHGEIMERVERILRNVMEQNWEDCLDHDLSATLDLFRVARSAALLGYAWAEEAQDKAFGCGRFEVRFDSRVTASHSWSGNLQNGSSQGLWHTRATVVTKLLEVNSTGPLTWVDFSYTMQNTITDPGSTCHLSETGISTAPGQLRAVATPMLGSLNAFEGSPTPPPVPVMASVNVVGGSAPTETYQHTSCDGSTTTSTDSRWSWHYEDIGKHWATDPGQQAEDFIDSKTFTLSDGSAGSSTLEETTVEVWHRPQA